MARGEWSATPARVPEIGIRHCGLLCVPVALCPSQSTYPERCAWHCIRPSRAHAHPNAIRLRTTMLATTAKIESVICRHGLALRLPGACGTSGMDGALVVRPARFIFDLIRVAPWRCESWVSSEATNSPSNPRATGETNTGRRAQHRGRHRGVRCPTDRRIAPGPGVGLTRWPSPGSERGRPVGKSADPPASRGSSAPWCDLREG